MAILPVLDIQGGLVVRGVGGRRTRYRPIVSRWTDSTEPAAVARALASRFGFGEFYLADLDAIGGLAPALATFEALSREGFRLWVDAGLRTVADAGALVQAGVATLVAGLETIAGPHVLRELCAEHGSARVVFSLDLKAGRVLGATDAWPSMEPSAIVEHAIAMGIRRLLVLDLAQVGTGNGTGTEELCHEIAAAHPEMRLAAGGGIASLEDVRRLEDCGAESVLVASALHDGRIRPG